MVKLRTLLPVFLLAPLFCGPTFAQSTDQLEQRIHRLQQTVQSRRLLVSDLRPDRPLTMPVGIGDAYTGQPPILIDNLVLYPDHAEFSAYAVLNLPGSQQPIYFASPSPVSLSFNGGISGTARLELVNDKEVPMGVGDASLLIKKASSFIEFGCGGFVQAGLGVEVTLPSKLVKEPAAGSRNVNDRVKGQFSTVFSDPNNILASVAIEPFHIKGVDALTFTVNEAVIDLSDFSNAVNMEFPNNYVDDYLGDVEPEVWRGIYLKTVSLRLPEEIKDHSTPGRKEIGVRDLLIDGQGLSGEVFAKNVLRLESGDLSGWSYSIDELSIGLTASQLEFARFEGGLVIPIAGETPLNYRCTFSPGKEYIFNVSTGEKLSFEIFKAAEVNLDPGSSVEIALEEKRFHAAANLSGTMSISAGVGAEDDVGGFRFNAADIRFEQLIVSTKAPFLHSGYFDAGAKLNVGTFQGSISDIRLVKKAEARGLGFTLKVSLMGANDSKNGFSADADLLILGTIENNNNKQKYRHSSTAFTKVWIDVDQGSFALSGQLNFFSNSINFGHGFKGQISARIEPGFEIAATALFGKVKDQNYWYADALTGFSPGIPIAGPMVIDGFAGGLYYGVKQKAGAGDDFAVVNSQTGLSYLPDPGAGLGVRAAVRLGLAQKKDVFNGNLGFEISFNKGGGIGRILFMGNANFLQEPSLGGIRELEAGSKILASIPAGSVNNTSAFDQINKRGALAASMLIDLDLNNKSLFANFKAFINLAGGQLRGVNAGGMAGEGALYFAPDTWYIHIGTPLAPVGVELAGIARTTSYFMVGKDLPGSPPPPPNVSEILGGQNLDYMRDLNALSSGRGLAFGSGLNFDTGNLTFLIFYARFAAGAGFDVMLKDYGDQALSNGKPLGINGWYANGQVYAYLQGKIGIRVNVFGSSKTFDIIDLGAAAVLQAKLPNPTWMHGIVGGHYAIMGGMLKGNCRFEFTIGQEPKISGTDVLANAGVHVIAEVTPKNSERAVDVFTVPQVLFNIPIGQSFSINDPTGRNVDFRAQVAHFAVTQGSTSVAGSNQWNGDNTVLAFNPVEILQPSSAVTINVKVIFEENVNGSWRPYLINGSPYSETVSNTFTTGPAPENIPVSNVAYSYPTINQLNYYRKESSMGYIKLKRGQSYVFTNSGKRPVGRVRSSMGDMSQFDLSYSNGEITFTLPEIRNNEHYELALVSIPQSVASAVDKNVRTEETQIGSSSQADITLTSRKAEGALIADEEQQIFKTSFRSSRYSTLSEKLSQPANSYSYIRPLRNGVQELGFMMQTPELFEAGEIVGSEPLLRLEADLTDNGWYKTYIYPFVYQSYSSSTILSINWRQVPTLGAPPIYATSIKNLDGVLPKYVNEQSSAVSGNSAFVYSLPHYIEKDYQEIQSRVANAIASGSYSLIPNNVRPILSTPYMPAMRGRYPIKVTYVLPGINKVSSVNYITIYNELGY